MSWNWLWSKLKYIFDSRSSEDLKESIYAKVLEAIKVFFDNWSRGCSRHMGRVTFRPVVDPCPSDILLPDTDISSGNPLYTLIASILAWFSDKTGIPMLFVHPGNIGVVVDSIIAFGILMFFILCIYMVFQEEVSHDNSSSDKDDDNEPGPGNQHQPVRNNYGIPERKAYGFYKFKFEKISVLVVIILCIFFKSYDTCVELLSHNSYCVSSCASIPYGGFSGDIVIPSNLYVLDVEDSSVVASRTDKG